LVAILGAALWYGFISYRHYERFKKIKITLLDQACKHDLNLEELLTRFDNSELSEISEGLKDLVDMQTIDSNIHKFTVSFEQEPSRKDDLFVTWYTMTRLSSGCTKR
jgi:hypothetical protein